MIEWPHAWLGKGPGAPTALTGLDLIRAHGMESTCKRSGLQDTGSWQVGTTSYYFNLAVVAP